MGHILMKRENSSKTEGYAKSLQYPYRERKNSIEEGHLKTAIFL